MIVISLALCSRQFYLIKLFAGLKYKLRLEFPAGYPINAPTVRFTTPCFHPNVDAHGNICLDILKEKWSALYEVRTILLSIQSLLGKNCVILFKQYCFSKQQQCYKPAYPNVPLNFLAEPNNDSPLNTHASSLWQNKTAYQKLLLEKYNKEAQDGSKSSTQSTMNFRNNL